MKILFDVGANNGSSSLQKIKNNKDWICFAFEPTTRLIQEMANKSASFSDRYHIIPYAVSDFDGEADFYIAGQADWGCSSLLNFNSNLTETWPGRTDFKVTKTIKVKVITLKTFIEQMADIEINQIDYYHCDIQGSDLKGLQGLGEYINIVKEGVVEAALKKDILYINQNTAEDTESYLKEHNFLTTYYVNDKFGNETNIKFKRK